MSLLTAPARMIRAAGAAFTATLGQAPPSTLAIAPVYLRGLLYLIKRHFFEMAQEGFGQNAVVYRCLSLLSAAVAEPPLRSYIRDAEGNPDPAKPLPYGHALAAHIRTPNPLMTEFEYWELTTIFVGIAGIAHWWKERDRLGRVLAEWPLRPDRVGPVYAGPEDQADGMSVLLGWSYQVPGTSQYLYLRPQDVVTYNFPDPAGHSGGIVEGLSPLHAVASEVSADNEAGRFVGSLLSNYAMPGMVLQTQQSRLSYDDAQVIKQALMVEFGGRKRGEPAVIDSGSTLTSMGFNLQQMEFPQVRRISEARICAAYGVPPILAGVLVGLEQSSANATITEWREFFTETTCAVYWRRFAEQFTNDVASEFGPDIVCQFDLKRVKALEGQVNAKIDRYMNALDRGAVTIAEYREVLGAPSRPDTDVYMYGIAPGRGSQTVVNAQAPMELPNAEDTGQDIPDPAQNRGGKPTVTPPAQQGQASASTEAARSAPADHPEMRQGKQDLESAFDALMAGLEANA